MNYFTQNVKPIWILLFGWFCYTQSFAQELTWTLIENGTGISNSTEIVALPFVGGIGISSFTFGSSGAYAKSWSQADLDSDDYFELAFYSVSTDTFELKSIAFSERRSNTAIRSFDLMYSKQSNFENSILLESYEVPDNDSERERLLESLNILILPSDTFYLRWYGYNAESSAGSWRINDNSLKLNLQIYVLDFEAPTLMDAEVLDAKTIKMQFDESLDSNSIDKMHFSIAENQHPSTIDISNNKDGVLLLNFIDALPSEEAIHLSYSNIADLAGNMMQDIGYYELFYYNPKAFYILINELMVDPNPVVYLPEVEYIEFYNTKAFDIDLSGWSLRINDNNFMIPEKKIEAHSYLLIVPEESKQFFDTSLTIIEMDYGSLTNSGSETALYSDDTTWIHQVNYTSDWHQENHKKEGGWSLEMIDQEQACNMINNWSSSKDERGGSPGLENSIKGENIEGLDLEITNTYFDSSKVIISFNQFLSPSYQPTVDLFKLDVVEASEVFYKDGQQNLSLTFDVDLEEDIIYELLIDDEILTCEGQTIEVPKTMQIGIPTRVDSNDIVFNEILFKPLGNHRIYIEFYNRSQHILDLQELMLGLWEEDGIYFKDPILDKPKLIFPGDYFVLSKDRQDVLNQYYVKHPHLLIETEEIPSISSSEDLLYLMNKGDKIIDLMQYKSNFHNPILKISEGVALERINFDSPAMEARSWQSAAEYSGFGTPTYKNSQYSALDSSVKEEISFENESFSPDLDGYQDFLQINYLMEKTGYTASVNIYNSKGQHIIELISNELMAIQGQWIWDGRDKQDQSSPLGIYILYFEFIHADGSLIQKKKVCTLAGKI